jgi:hypothetical protein
VRGLSLRLSGYPGRCKQSQADSARRGPQNGRGDLKQLEKVINRSCVEGQHREFECVQIYRGPDVRLMGRFLLVNTCCWLRILAKATSSEDLVVISDGRRSRQSGGSARIDDRQFREM